MIRVFCIDPEDVFSLGLKASFSFTDDFLFVGRAREIVEAIPRIKRQRPDVILLDFWLKKTDPVGSVRGIQRIFPDIPLVILTRDNSSAWHRTMTQLGAAAYVLKSDDFCDIRRTILKVVCRIPVGSL
jgi:DNA-binding NarL/FixJ family response regulator